MLINVGPSHPLTHGTVRFVITLDGETVVKCDSENGYFTHRWRLQFLSRAASLSWGAPGLIRILRGLPIRER